MGFYLISGSYTSASAQAMVATPMDRSVQAKSMVESMGGTLHHFFFSLGDTDYVALCELPDDVAAAATSLALGASGGFSKTTTTKLLTTAEAQQAMTKAKGARFAAPGKG